MGPFVVAFACLWGVINADPSRSITVGSVRFSFLTDAVLRIETAKTFEDRPSITFPQRTSQPVPSYTVVTMKPLVVTTSAYTLRFTSTEADSAPLFDCAHLNITFMVAQQTVTACVGEAKGRVPTDPSHPTVFMDEWTDILKGPAGNLNGSLDTTDCYLGLSSACYNVYQSRMQLGLVSREGWSVVDDSETALFDGDADWEWRVPRETPTSDWYVFAHGHNYKQAVRDFAALAGGPSLKPWRAYGVWQSRELEYNDALVRQTINDYHTYELPLNMWVLDYGWHVGPYDPQDVKSCNQPTHAGGQCFGGYGGYVWNKADFPDPPSFQAFMHSQGLELCLNIHDQCGMDKCQTHYAEAASRLGFDPAVGAPLECRLLNKTYSLALAELVLEEGDNAGIDYWWNDYGVGGPGSGTFQINCSTTDDATPDHPLGPPSFPHCMRCYDDAGSSKPALWSAYARVSRREIKDLRGMVLGIYGGLGHHRYPAVGSGDTFEGMDTLSFEIYLTFTAANVLNEWNHDLGGFMPGNRSVHTADGWQHDPETYLRWLQAGVFQPIFRTHMCEGGDPRPWTYPNFPLMQKAFQLRNAFVPYLYSASFEGYSTGVLPIHPLYYEWPEEADAYAVSQLNGPEVPLQHMFGDSFVVAPITDFVDVSTNTLSWSIWVPPGQWVDWWTGVAVTGPKYTTRNYSLAETPLLARAGSIIPMKSLSEQARLSPLILELAVVWAVGVKGSGTYYEDDGSNLQYRNGAYRMLEADFVSSATSASISVMPRAQGQGYNGEPESREYSIRIRNAPSSARAIQCEGCSKSFEWFWDAETLPVLVLSTGTVFSNSSLQLSFQF